MSRIHLVFRSYGQENRKNRPRYYSKALALASFARAASALPDHDITFVNNGPIDTSYVELMKAFGRVVRAGDSTLGVQDSFRFALAMPAREGWSHTDLVSFNEDDYLFHPSAFEVLDRAADELLDVPYFALHGRLPRPDESPEQARLKYELPRSWRPKDDRQSGGVVWRNAVSTTGTFAARIGALQEDLPVFHECMRPFRTRYLDHEICIVYQGCAPYAGKELLMGLPRDFQPSLRGILRTAVLVPFRLRLNAMARSRTTAHPLYVSSPNLAAHLEADYVGADQDWLGVAHDTADWTAREGFSTLAAAIRSRL